MTQILVNHQLNIISYYILVTHKTPFRYRIVHLNFKVLDFWQERIELVETNTCYNII